MLTEWGQCKQPYSSYYGQVEAADIGACGRSPAGIICQELAKVYGYYRRK